MTIPPDVIVRLKELDIEDVASALGIEVRKHKALCFMHDDHNPSITFSRTKNLYKCWACGKGGGTIQLTQDKLGLNFQDACVWLAGQFNVWRPEDSEYKRPIKKAVKNILLPTAVKDTSSLDVEVCSWLIDNAKLSEQAKTFLYKERYLKEDVIQSLNIKSVSDSRKAVEALISHFGGERCLKSGLVRKRGNTILFFFSTPCLLFPYYEENGKLLGIQSRYLGDSQNVPRFQFMVSCKARVFNLPILNTLNYGDRLYISEGITDCLALLSSGLKAVAIPSATILPKEDLALLKSYDLRMFPDHDEAGQKAFIDIRRFFVNLYSTVRAEQLPANVKDYSDYYISTHIQNGEQRAEDGNIHRG